MRKTTKIALALGALALAGTATLSAYTVADARGGWQGRGDGMHGRTMRGHGQRMLFERFDLDGDSKLSQDEINEAREQLFARHDADNDGTLTLEEFEDLWLEVMRRRMVRSFQHLNDDASGEITLEQFLGPFASIVERLDSSGDGVITRGDLRRGGWHRGRGHHRRMKRRGRDRGEIERRRDNGDDDDDGGRDRN